jgi:hypothetical protein
MTKIERKAIAKAIEQSKRPSVLGAEISKELGRIEHVNPFEAGRLLDSADYVKGWEACHLQMAEALRFISSAKAAEVKKYSEQK